MPIFRIVYIDDDTFAPRALTAAFPDRAAAEIAMAKHGHRIAHIAEMGAGECERGPVAIPMAPACDAAAPPARPGESGHARAPQTLIGLPAYDLAGAFVVVAGIAIAGAALLLF